MKKLVVFGLAALLVAAFTLPAAADVKVGGIVFTDFYYYGKDKENKGDDDYANTRIEVPGITRLNARWTNEDNVGMFIEFGIGGATKLSSGQYSPGGTSVTLRHAYGWWDVSPAFQIMAGHSTTPFSPLNPSQLIGTNSGGLHIIGVGYGDFYSGRFPQVRGTFTFSKNARLAIALVDPNIKSDAFRTLLPAETGKTVDNDTKVPRIDVGLPLYLGPIKLYPSGFFAKQTFDNVAAGYPDEVTSWGLSLGVKLGIGPLAIAAEGQTGENWGNTAGLIGNSPTAAYSAARLVGTAADDTECNAFWFDVSFKFGPITPHLIYGMQKVSGDKAPTDIVNQMYGVSIPIAAAKGFTIRPEFMWYDEGDSETLPDGSKADFGSEYIYGVQFQIVF